MERLQFYPADENPKGKNYIFFAAHPEDKEQYFHTLWKEITAVEDNCVFWYDSTPSLLCDAAFFEQLKNKRMLYVFPVTTNLLTKENNAISQLLPFAQENHFPILPIMLETGLTDLYSTHFRDLQYMDKATTDITAIPYEKKLERFLKDVLIDEETAKKIRGAFVAYIFLSYRKKDREQAIKLMKLIHEIPQMRRVAIWYDEFLTAGENFNANIQDAMNKSALFALAMTPNMCEANNYVKRKEYPMAQKGKMPIVAAQMEKLDAQELLEFLQGPDRDRPIPPEKIPQIVDAYNQEEFSQSLFDGLRHIALEQTNTTWHNYLMGLAYLNGIDVEVNTERALELLTAAADDELPEAYEQIVSMYYHGVGVERDIFKAIGWQKTYVTSLFWYEGLPEQDRKLIHAQQMLGELQMRVDCCAAHKTFSELRDFLESQRNTKAAEEDELAHDLSLCYSGLGNIHLKDGDYDIAQTCFFNAFANQMDWARRCNTAEALREAAVCMANLGNACMSDNKYEKAKECFEIACNILSEKVPCSSKQQKDIATIYRSRGQACLLQLKPTDPTQIKKQILDDGTQWLQKALDIRRQLVEKTNAPECRRDLALSLFELGKVYYENGLFDCAFAYNMEGHQLIKEVEEETGFWNDRCLLAFSYIPLAECRLKQKTADLKEAERWCNDCIALSERLLSEQPTDTLSSAYYLTRAYCLMGRICLRKKAGPQSAKKWAKKALAIDEAVAKALGNTQSLYNLSDTYMLMIEICQAEHSNGSKWLSKRNAVIKKMNANR